MRKITGLAIALALTFVLPRTGQVLAQMPSPIEGMQTVPSERRSGLLQGLTDLVSHYCAKDWKGVFERLTQIPTVDESVGEFSSRLSQAYPANIGRSIVSFEVDGIVEQPASQWAVWGCLALKGNSKRMSHERWIVIASWERNGWFFSELRPAVQLDGRKPIPCNPKR